MRDKVRATEGQTQPYKSQAAKEHVVSNYPRGSPSIMRNIHCRVPAALHEVGRKHRGRRSNFKILVYSGFLLTTKGARNSQKNPRQSWTS